MLAHQEGDTAIENITTVRAVIPLAGQAGRKPAMADQTASSRSGPKADFGT
jgi:hypothetical protein